MAKRKGKRRPVDMGVTTPVSSDSSGMMEQYLTPGTPERERLLAMQEDIQFDAGLSTVQLSEKDEVSEKQVEEVYGDAQGVRNYRNFMKKYAQVEDTREIIEEGLGRKVSGTDLDDELYDPSVSAKDFKKEAVADHAAEFSAKREVPELDTNGDRVVNEQDDPVMTPGMRRMARYM